MEEKRSKLYMETAEVKELQSVIKRLTSELHDQVQENLCEREQLTGMLDKYEGLHAHYESMLAHNQRLKGMTNTSGGANTKDHVLGLLGQKVQMADEASRRIEKALAKGEIDCRAFINSYVD